MGSSLSASQHPHPKPSYGEETHSRLDWCVSQAENSRDPGAPVPEAPQWQGMDSARDTQLILASDPHAAGEGNPALKSLLV